MLCGKLYTYPPFPSRFLMVCVLHKTCVSLVNVLLTEDARGDD